MKMHYLILKSLCLALACLSPFSTTSVQASESGKDLYKAYCWQCHGMNADGLGVNIRDMSVQPRDHTDKKEMSARTDEELFNAIRDGGRSIGKSLIMPAWKGVLSDEEVRSLVVYLRELCKC